METEFCTQHQSLLDQINKRVPIWIFLGAVGVMLALTALTFNTLRADIKAIQTTTTQIDRKVVELDTKMNVLGYFKTALDGTGAQRRVNK